MTRLLLNARLQRVKQLREECAAATEHQSMSSDLPAIRHNCAIRQMRLIQQLWQRAQQGRLWNFFFE